MLRLQHLDMPCLRGRSAKDEPVEELNTQAKQARWKAKQDESGKAEGLEKCKSPKGLKWVGRKGRNRQRSIGLKRKKVEGQNSLSQMPDTTLELEGEGSVEITSSTDLLTLI